MDICQRRLVMSSTNNQAGTHIPTDTDERAARPEPGAAYTGGNSAGAAMTAKKAISLIVILLTGFGIGLGFVNRGRAQQEESAVQIQTKKAKANNFDDQISANVQRMIAEGRKTFRFDTFGDEAFWGDMLKLHQAI